VLLLVRDGFDLDVGLAQVPFGLVLQVLEVVLDVEPLVELLLVGRLELAGVVAEREVGLPQVERTFSGRHVYKF